MASYVAIELARPSRWRRRTRSADLVGSTADAQRARERSGILFDIVAVLGGSLATGLAAQAAIHLPFTPVPITGQTFAVLLVAALLGSRRGAMSMILYLAEGAAGLPVFGGGAAGPAILAGPTGGYLIGFVPAAWAVGALAERGWDRRVPTTLVAFLAGNALIYAFGLPWLALHVGWERTLALGFLPFAIGDALKLLLAAIVLPGGWRLARSRGWLAPELN